MSGSGRPKHEHTRRKLTDRDSISLVHRELYDELEVMFSQSLDIIGLGNLDGHFTKVNPSVGKLLGYSEEEFCAVPFLHFVHPDDYAKTEQELADAQRGKKEIFIENRYRCKEGSFKWIDWKVFVTKTEKRFIAVGRDISERKQNEERLRLQSTIIEKLAEGVCLIRGDDLTILWTNSKFEEMFGYDPGELIGRHLSIIHPRTEKGPPEQHEEIYSSLKEKGEWHGEVENARKDGSPFFSYSHVSSFQHLTYDLLFVSVRTDITARKEMEEALRESELQKTLLLNSASEGIFGLDKQGRTTFVNQAAKKMLGFSDPDLIAKNNHLIIHHTKKDGTTYHECDCPMMAAIAQDRQIFVDDEVLWRKDGTSFPAEYRSTPIRHNDEVIGAVVLFSDVTEKRRQERMQRQLAERFQQMQKHQSLNSMAAGIAHNFNNILMSVMGALELSLTTLPVDREEREYLDVALKASRRAADLSTMMLQFVGQGQMKLQKLELSKLIGEMAEILAPQLKSEISVSPKSGGGIYIEADMGMIRQVVANLVNNAADALGQQKDGKITMEFGQRFYTQKELKQPYLEDELPEGEYAFLTVKDNGHGMKKDILNRVFDPFFTTRFPGRGLGLASVLGIVRTHRGSVSLKSRPGNGTSATVLFPVMSTNFMHPVQSQPKFQVKKAMTFTVLLVDDDQMLRNVGEKILNKFGFDVLLAADGLEALDIFEQKMDEIDIILLDISMPRLDGFETLKEIREKSEVPVIMITGHSIEQVSDQLKNIANVSILEKPFGGEKLKAKMKEMIFFP